MYIKTDLCATLLCALSLLALTSCSTNKPVVLATWTYVNATKAGLYGSVTKVYYPVV